MVEDGGEEVDTQVNTSGALLHDSTSLLLCYTHWREDSVTSEPASSFLYSFFFIPKPKSLLFSFPVPLNFRTLCSKLKIVQSLQKKCVKNSLSVCLIDWLTDRLFVCQPASQPAISTSLLIYLYGQADYCDTQGVKRRTPCRMEGKSLCHKTSSVKACFHPGFTAVVETLVQCDICWCRLPGWGRAQHHQSVFYEHEVNIFSVLNTIIRGFNINYVFWLLISPRHTLCRLFLLSEVIAIFQTSCLQQQYRIMMLDTHGQSHKRWKRDKNDLFW